MAHYPGIPVLTFIEMWDGYACGHISIDELNARKDADEMFCTWLKRSVRESRKRIEAARQPAAPQAKR